MFGSDHASPSHYNHLHLLVG
jgi:hypothetical protein